MDPVEMKPSTTTLLQLPTEIKMSIFKYLCAEEVDVVKQVCRSLNCLVDKNSMYLARHRYQTKVQSPNHILIEPMVETKSQPIPFKLAAENEKLDRCLRHVQLANMTIRGPISEEDIDILIEYLHATHQFQIHSFVMQSVTIESQRICGKLFQLLSMANCQAITLEDCKLACGFTKEQATQMQDLCQFTVKNCMPTNGLGILGKYLTKLAADMRFKPRKSIPFYAEAPQLKASEICQFIKTWIQIYEAPFFQIYVNNCEPEFKTQFLCECSANGLTHYHLEFRSKAHPMAHIKVVFDEANRKFQMHPIVDVPARYDRMFCTARHFRDF